MHQVRQHRDHHHQEGHRRRPFRWWTLLPWLILAWAATGFYTVQPNENALVRRFGEALPHVRTPGLHFGLPYGFDRVTRVKVLERKRVYVWMSPTARALGRRVDPRSAECVTGDRNLILLSAIVQYRVADVKAYLFNVADVPGLIQDTAAGAFSSLISSMKVDDILTVERVAIQQRVLQNTQSLLDRYRAGVKVTSVSLESVTPPQEVAEAFRDVTGAREDRARAINEAQGEANRLIPRARGKAQQVLREAEGLAGEAVERARGEADRFNQVAAQLAGNRQLTMKRLILESMEKILPRLNKVIIDGSTENSIDLGIFQEKE